MAQGKKTHIVHILYSFGTGGMEKGIATVVNNSLSRFDHTILCLVKSGKSKALLSKKVKIIEMHKKEGNSLFFIFRLARKLRELNPDIVHTRNWGGFDGVIAAKLAGVRYIFHGEHGWSMDDPYGLNRKRVIIRRIMDRFIHGYTAVSRQIQEWLLRDIRVSRPVVQICNGVDCKRYSPGDGSIRRQNLVPGRDCFVFGIVARLDPIKNHHTLIRVFNRINKAWPQTCLLVAGNGPEMERLKTIACDNVKFLGNRPDVPDLLRCMDVFVLPSLNEGISNTILEAMESGLPVAASDRGGNPELVVPSVNGVLFDPENEEELENSIVRYIADKDLIRTHGDNGRSMALTRYSIDAMVTGYTSAWSTIRQRSGNP